MILLLAYDVGVNLLSASGNERKILTADGGSIRIKQVGFVHQGDNLSICIENDDSLLHVYQGPGQQQFPSIAHRTVPSYTRVYTVRTVALFYIILTKESKSERNIE